MTKEEFKVWFDANFWAWVGGGPRSKASFLLSLEDFATREYILTNRKEQEEKKPKSEPS